MRRRPAPLKEWGAVGIERVVYAASKELAAAMLSAPEDGAAALRVVHAPPAGDSLPFER